MINATLYKFSKRVNSTKQPTGGESVSVALKEQCSVYTPVLLLNSNFAIISEYNYVKFLDNYYYITDIVSISNNHIEIHCQLDVMATFKKEILATTAYVLYSMSGTTDILDNRLLMRKDFVIGEAITTLSEFGASNTFVLSVVGDSGSTLTGFTDSYVLYPNEMKSIATQMLSPSIIETLKDFFASPFDAIVSLTWLPITAGSIAGGSIPVKIGNYNTGISGKAPANIVIENEVEVAIPPSVRKINYLDGAPYTEITLYLPFVGVIQIDSNILYNQTSLQIKYMIDIITSDITYLVRCNGTTICTQTGRCGTVLPVAASGINVMQYVSGVASIMGGIAVGGMVGAGAAVAGLASSASGLQTNSQINGGFGGRAGLIDTAIRLKLVQHKCSDNPVAINRALGLPYGKTVTLGSLSGYVQCSNASVQANTSNDYLSQINDYLNGGAYIE